MKHFCAWLLGGAVVLAAAMGPAFAQEPATAPAASGSSGTGIPFKRDTVPPGETAYRTFAALVVVLAVGALAVYVLRARGMGNVLLPPASNGRLQVLETRRIAPKMVLVVVRWNAEELLLSHGEGGTALLARAPAATPAERT